MKPIVQGSSRSNATARSNSPASAAPPVYRPNASPAVQRMEAPAVYRPNSAGTAQRVAAPAIHSAQGNAPVQRAVYKPNESAAVQRVAAPAVYRPNAAVPMQQMAAPPALTPRGAVHVSMATPLPMYPPSMSAPSRPFAAQPVMQAKQAPVVAGGSMAPTVTPKSNTIQREIFKFEQDKWALERPGTPGTRKLPDRPKDGKIYFNNVTGKRGRTIKAVEAGLVDLMMVNGSLKDLKGNVQWPDQLWKDLHKSTDDGSVNYMGTIRVRCNTDLKTHLYKYKWNKSWHEPLKKVWNELLKPFMQGNGQLPYIFGQEWFKSGDMVVDISVNFYNNRAGEDRSFEFHKDTAGDNLFVNLVFNNKQPMLATEWVIDKQKMHKAKRDQMIQYMGGDSVVNAINATRDSIEKKKYRPTGTSKIEGGVVTGEAFFVSWVDELIWHSSPSEKSRTQSTRFDISLLKDPTNYIYGFGGDVNNDEDFKKRENYKYWVVRKALRTLRAVNGTQIKENGRSPDTDKFKWNAQIDQYIGTIVNPDGTPKASWNRHLKDINDYSHKIMLTYMIYGEDQAGDPSNSNTSIMRFTNINKLQRQNSIIAGLGAGNPLQQASATTEPRSFIRSWVQIHHKDYPLTVVGA
jgi:hypothetical protein